MDKMMLVFLLWLSSVSTDGIAVSYEYLSDHYFTSIHVLVVNPREHGIRPVKAHPKETVASLAQQYGALAAVNGGFWKSDGSPAGILKIDHHWYGMPSKPRGAIGWDKDGRKVLIDRVLTSVDENFIEVIPISDLAHTTSEEWKETDHIIGGTPVLISQGNVVEDYSSEKTLSSFLTKKHPRTAVGIKESGEWVFVVVDGSFYGLLGGMTIKELAELMFELGCVEALNLDGGGSSTMVVEGVIVNQPAGSILEEGKYVEEVSDAILIFSKEK